MYLVNIYALSIILYYIVWFWLQFCRHHYLYFSWKVGAIMIVNCFYLLLLWIHTNNLVQTKKNVLQLHNLSGVVRNSLTVFKKQNCTSTIEALSQGWWIEFECFHVSNIWMKPSKINQRPMIKANLPLLEGTWEQSCQ